MNLAKFKQLKNVYENKVLKNSTGLSTSKKKMFQKRRKIPDVDKVAEKQNYEENIAFTKKDPLLKDKEKAFLETLEHDMENVFDERDEIQIIQQRQLENWEAGIKNEMRAARELHEMLDKDLSSKKASKNFSYSYEKQYKYAGYYSPYNDYDGNNYMEFEESGVDKEATDDGEYYVPNIGSECTTGGLFTCSFCCERHTGWFTHRNFCRAYYFGNCEICGHQYKSYPKHMKICPKKNGCTSLRKRR